MEFDEKYNRFFFTIGLIFLSAALPACKASYPKEDIKKSVKKIFQKELGVEPETELIGQTLYVSFPLENMVSQTFELPKEVVQKLEDAMLAITRISLSTDANIQFTVLEARDLKWGVQTTIIRRMQDLKGLMYWGVSKQDFDERLVLETKKIVESSTVSWQDITLPEFMARWVASRISLGTRANPFLGVLLGIEKVNAQLDQPNRLLTLQIEGASTSVVYSTSSLSMDLLKSSIGEQMSLIEKKYPAKSNGKSDQELRDPDWVKEIVVQDPLKKEVMRISKEEWTRSEAKTTLK